MGTKARLHSKNNITDFIEESRWTMTSTLIYICVVLMVKDQSIIEIRIKEMHFSKRIIHNVILVQQWATIEVVSIRRAGCNRKEDWLLMVATAAMPTIIIYSRLINNILLMALQWQNRRYYKEVLWSPKRPRRRAGQLRKHLCVSPGIKDFYKINRSQ